LKKALILTYYWPPGSGPGVQRWLKFCKYLPENGWEPTVITVRNGSYPYSDKTLVNDVPQKMKVIKTDTFEPFAIYNLLRGKKGKSVEVGLGSIKNQQNRFSRFANYIRANYFIPDARLGWNKYAFVAALRHIKSERPDVIITTGPPHSTHLIGQRLNKEFQIPWVADFRDPWTTIYYNSLLNRTESRKTKDQEFENSVVTSCNMLLVTTPGMEQEFSERAKKIICIPNGFDSEDFIDHPIQKSDAFVRLSYVGNLKANQNAPMLWKAIAELSKNEVFKSSFRLCFTGSVHPEIIKSIEDSGIKQIVELNSFVAHKEAVEIMQQADALLLPIPQSPGNKLILTGKIFEYLATRRPILSLGPKDGNASAILNKVNNHPMKSYDDFDEISSFLSSIVEQAQKTGQLESVGNDQYQSFSRQGLTESLSDTLDQAIESP
jgi:glycosyltransferase involved in cell wall biosynthesis